MKTYKLTFLIILLILNNLLFNSCNYEKQVEKKVVDKNLITSSDTAEFINKISPEHLSKIINSVRNVLLLDDGIYLYEFSSGINIVINERFYKYYYKNLVRFYEDKMTALGGYGFYSHLTLNTFIQKEPYGVGFDIGNIDVVDKNSKNVSLIKHNVSEFYVEKNFDGYYYEKYFSKNDFGFNGSNARIIHTQNNKVKEYEIYCPEFFDKNEILEINPITVDEILDLRIKDAKIIDDSKPYSVNNLKDIKYDTTRSYDDYIDLTKGDLNIKWYKDSKNLNGVVLILAWHGEYSKEDDPFNRIQFPSFPKNSPAFYLYKIVEDNGNATIKTKELESLIIQAPQYIYVQLGIYRFSMSEFEFNGDKYPISCGNIMDEFMKIKLK